MSDDLIDIVECPGPLVHEALALALRDLLPGQRREFADAIRDNAALLRTLYIARHDERVLDAAWGQPQPGNTAIFWPPQRSDGVARRLCDSVCELLDRAGIRMTQTMVIDANAPVVSVLRSAGFGHLVDLVYLSWESTPIDPTEHKHLEFEPFETSQLERLTRLTESTYVGTQDCPAMNGRRPMADVIAGYRETGSFRPENWLFVRSASDDVGVLLLTDHTSQKYWELVYMGLVPQARGQSWGRQIVRQAQRMVRAADVERLLVAVDAANAPAVNAYRSEGFNEWDRRTVFARFANSES